MSNDLNCCEHTRFSLTMSYFQIVFSRCGSSCFTGMYILLYTLCSKRSICRSVIFSTNTRHAGPTLNYCLNIFLLLNTQTLLTPLLMNSYIYLYHYIYALKQSSNKTKFSVNQIIHFLRSLLFINKSMFCRLKLTIALAFIASFAVFNCKIQKLSSRT